ncbi:pentapeptide repeat-containing protein [Aminobacter sp. NyZ550]|uniref:pentapeptide repeat-containing protein n=1 Tax=Aminobacter sp. NyZ550 TaxID=2979870 RepID=UPI0021D60A48|nr:pentapeptide repeat-containing protein [Aminobacter sp. NyZ550]WAX94915.1 pentapeptide repeat-containing protein [Aminobacter sp. NyZ550]
MKATGLGLCLAMGLAAAVQAAPSDCARGPLGAKPANLTSILKEHSRWLATWDKPNPKGRQADLSHIDLSGEKFAELDLRRAKFAGSRLQGATFDKARLDESDLTCVEAEGASFANADLFLATLANASLVGTDFAGGKLGGANLSGVNLTNANLTDVDLRRADLQRARLRNTRLERAAFADVNLAEAVWQPIDLPEVGSMGTARNIKTLKFDFEQVDRGGLSRLVKELRDAGLDSQAKEAAHALERATVGVDLRNWKQPVKALWAAIRAPIGWLTDYGLALGQGFLVLVLWNAAFMPLYYRYGFSPAIDRPSGIVRIIPEKTLQSGPTGERYTTESMVVPLAPPTRLGRALWACSFTAIASVRFGIGQFNILAWLERFVSWFAATGWIGWAADVQSFGSAVLLASLVYAYWL